MPLKSGFYPYSQGCISDGLSGEGHFADSGNHAIRGQIMPSAIMPSAIMAAKGGFAALRAVRRLRNRPPAIASSGRSLDTTSEPAG